MLDNVENWYEGLTLEIDGNSYRGCSFVNCRLIYRGTAPIGFDRCSFTHTGFQFEGAAANTAAFLNALAGDPGMKEVVSFIIPNLKPRGPLN